MLLAYILGIFLLVTGCIPVAPPSVKITGYIQIASTYPSLTNSTEPISITLTGEVFTKYKAVVTTSSSCQGVNFTAATEYPIGTAFTFIPTENATTSVCFIGSDEHDNWQESATQSPPITVDTIAPELIVSTDLPSSATNLISTKTVAFSSLEEIGALKVKKYKFSDSLTTRCDGNTPDSSQTVASDLLAQSEHEGSSFSFLPDEGDGFYIVCAIARDLVGNWNPIPIATSSFELDTTGPTITIDSTGLGDLLSNSTSLRSVTLSGANAYKVTYTTLSTCSVTMFTYLPETTATTYSFSPTQERSYKVCAIGRDALGNWSDIVSSDTLVIDLTAPTIGINSSGLGTSPSNDLSARSVTFNGGVAYKASYVMDGNCNSVDFDSMTESTSSTYSFTPTTDGDYTVCAKGRDEAGNWSVISASSSVTIDTVAPTITLDDSGIGISPSSSTEQRTVELAGGYIYKIRLLNASNCDTASLDTYSTQQFSSLFSFTPTADGTYILCAIGRDEAGNWSSVISSRTFVIDSAFVPLTITASTTQADTFSATLDSALTINYFYMKIVTSTEACPTSTDIADWVYSYTDPLPFSINDSDLITGTYKVCAKARDTSGYWTDTIASSLISFSNSKDLAFSGVSTADYKINATLSSTRTNVSSLTLKIAYDGLSCTTGFTLMTVSSNSLVFSSDIEFPNGSYKLCGEGTLADGRVLPSIEFSTSVLSSLDDPLYPYQWHLKNLGQSTFATAGGTVGVSHKARNVIFAGFTGTGIYNVVLDEAVDWAHADLAANYDVTDSRDYSLALDAGVGVSSSPGIPTGIDTAHGTAVAGIISAVGNNGIGVSGIAPNSTFATRDVFQVDTTSEMVDAIDGTFDVHNSSIGLGINCTYVDKGAVTDLYDPTQLATMISTGRGGNGSIFTKSAGNSHIDYFTNECSTNPKQASLTSGEIYYLGNSNSSPWNRSPEVIVVGAFNADAEKSSYSSTGSNIWVSGAGGEFGSTSPAILTTDISGCTDGFSNSSGTTSFNRGEATHTYKNSYANPNCDYTNTMNGTSSAAPSIAGVVNLILEANPALTWREVKYILAKTAVKPPITIDTAHPFTSYVASGIFTTTLTSVELTGHTAIKDWTTNSAGFHFHNWYGFGIADAEAAVALAQSMDIVMNAYTTLPLYDSGPLTLAIPDQDAAGVTSTQTVTETGFYIESVVVTLSITHPYNGDLGIELTSPSGAVSQLTYINNGKSGAGYTNAEFLVNNFFGEDVTGDWTLKVIDSATNDTGTLTNWQIKFNGHYK